MNIEYVNREAINPADYNPRSMSADMMEKLIHGIKEFGLVQPIVVNRNTGNIVGGHQRFEAAKHAGMVEIPVCYVELSPEKERMLNLALNKITGDWDHDLLQKLLADLPAEIDLALTGFNQDEVDELLKGLEVEQLDPQCDEDETPAPQEQPISVAGDVWQLGRHRVMCGDSCMIDHAEKLMNGHVCELLHADPPYGMGKEKDGVANDNLYEDKLDEFQMEWWATFRIFLVDNGSAYIWGNPEDLWRLWHLRIAKSEPLSFRNEIVWDKGAGFGMSSGEMRSYSVSTERCLFFMLGKQAFGNVNTEDYWEGWEPIRQYLKGEADKMNWGSKEIVDITGVGMYSHWFTKSQWTMIPEKHYNTLQRAANGAAFLKPYDGVRDEYDGQRNSGEHLSIKSQFDAMRSFFDNTHDNMTEVWRFERVVGDDRHGHATPKPVVAIERMIRSSCKKDGNVVEPFGGSGTTLIACEKAQRTCFTMEIEPRWVDVIVRRWQKYTGKEARHVDTGATFGEIAAQRKPAAA